MKAIAASLVLLPAALGQVYSGTANVFTSDIINYDGSAITGPMTCGQRATPADVWTKDTTNTCGTQANPCPVGMSGVTASTSPECGQCFKVQLSRPAVTDAVRCAGGSCPAFTSEEVFVVVRAALGEETDIPQGTRKFDFSQLGWSIVCPFVCKGLPTGSTAQMAAGNVCVAAATACEIGVAEDTDGLGPGSEDVTALQNARWQQVDCTTGTNLSTTAPTTEAPSTTASSSGAYGVLPTMVTVVGLIGVAFWAL